MSHAAPEQAVLLDEGLGAPGVQVPGEDGLQRAAHEGVLLHREPVSYTHLDVYKRQVGKSLVNLIESTGGKAMGICGIDGKLIEAKSKSPALG